MADGSQPPAVAAKTADSPANLAVTSRTPRERAAVVPVKTDDSARAGDPPIVVDPRKPFESKPAPDGGNARESETRALRGKKEEDGKEKVLGKQNSDTAKEADAPDATDTEPAVRLLPVQWTVSRWTMAHDAVANCSMLFVTKVILVANDGKADEKMQFAKVKFADAAAFVAIPASARFRQKMHESTEMGGFQRHKTESTSLS
jgi:hypothetical protein